MKLEWTDYSFEHSNEHEVKIRYQLKLTLHLPQAKIPSPLTAEQEAKQAASLVQRRKAQRQIKQARQKEKKKQEREVQKEEEEKTRYLELSDREKVPA